jgi:multisubunit Na+/H+ antiporter MnhE subunit
MNQDSKCKICEIPGTVCVDLVITGSRHVVHWGECHDKLVEKEKIHRAREKAVAAL